MARRAREKNAARARDANAYTLTQESTQRSIRLAALCMPRISRLNKDFHLMSLKRNLLPLLAGPLCCLASSVALAEASSIEVDAAVARMASAAYKIEVMAACGFPKDEGEKVQVQLFAMAMALQADGLSRKLSTEQFVGASTRVRNADFMASMQARAKKEATPSECSKPETRAFWDNLLRYKESLRKK